jgi:uncharacterized protein (DUF1684 family)
MSALASVLDVVDWRRQVFALYGEVRQKAGTDPAAAHAHWRAARDALFATHPATPLLPDARAAFTGMPVAPYDPAWRYSLPVEPLDTDANDANETGGATDASDANETGGTTDASDSSETSGSTGASGTTAARLEVATGTDGIVPFERLGRVEVPGAGRLDVWRLASYGGGVFLPVRDALGRVPGGTYGGGRYVLDTVKGADLGPGDRPGELVIDFNFAYNPSCAYDPRWACPLAPPGNVLTVEVPVGERYRND